MSVAFKMLKFSLLKRLLFTGISPSQLRQIFKLSKIEYGLSLREYLYFTRFVIFQGIMSQLILAQDKICRHFISSNASQARYLF